MIKNGYICKSCGPLIAHITVPYNFIFILFYLTVPGLSCSMWDLIPQPGAESRLPELGMESLSHWTTRKVPAVPGHVCLHFFHE